MIYDVIIIGGSYAGLQAAMTLGRALMNVLVVDSGEPCNRQTPHSHNFLTRDGETPAQISAVAKEQVLKYPSVKFHTARATGAQREGELFSVVTAGGDTFTAGRLFFATGIRDLMPGIPGFADCWGITVVHCPYCHGYEVQGLPTGIMANGELGYEYIKMLSNWTSDITVFTNGSAEFTAEQHSKLTKKNIRVIEQEITLIDHHNGRIKRLVTGKDSYELAAVYCRPPFEQQSDIPRQLGCKMKDGGYIDIDERFCTSVPYVYAAGDCASQTRSIASVVSGGMLAGVFISKDIIHERF